MPAYDPDLSPFVALMPALDVSDVPAARVRLEFMTSGREQAPLPSGITVHRETATADGRPSVPVVIARSDDAPGSPLPALVYAHGGGFVLGSDRLEETAAHFADVFHGVVVSVDYRLAPEHPFPAALDDCETAFSWLVSNAEDLGVDPARIAVGGISAGACLAAGLALRARGRGDARPFFQLLETPVLDDRCDTLSMQEHLETPLWNRRAALASWAHYLPDASESIPVEAAPSREQDLRDLPPAYVSVAEYDPLRDEGIDYALRLLAAGVPTELHLVPGTFHGSAGALPTAASSRAMNRSRDEALARALRRTTGEDAAQ